MMSLLPRTKTPDLELPLTQGGTFSLSDNDAENFTLLIFYRGKHCPICGIQLKETQQQLDELAKRGIKAVAISMDDKERAEDSAKSWGIDNLPLAYGLNEEQARSYGLYISEGISEKEPARFSEPGMFLVRPDQSLYFASVQTMPFTRPALNALLMGIDYALKNDYPARGEVAA
ncbi:peroxiredoxin-like family protein [Parasphingorhabdus sp. DH2-15]|uniref:peroxiredoxin-like family protein n=1 Tax=Parasphingorhabdus sp. DH2-15 TaxID=3444112 RepID=UPI003F685362